MLIGMKFGMNFWSVWETVLFIKILIYSTTVLTWNLMWVWDSFIHV